MKADSTTTLEIGLRGEDRAVQYLSDQQLSLVARNFRCKRGEIDLIMKRTLGIAGRFELVFIEVRLRSRSEFGGAALSVSATKQRRIRIAAEFYLLKHFGVGSWPACRFDVIAFEASGVNWIQGAF